MLYPEPARRRPVWPLVAAVWLAFGLLWIVVLLLWIGSTLAGMAGLSAGELACAEAIEVCEAEA